MQVRSQQCKSCFGESFGDFAYVAGPRVDGLVIERLDGNNDMVIRYFNSEELKELVKQYLIRAILKGRIKVLERKPKGCGIFCHDRRIHSFCRSE